VAKQGYDGIPNCYQSVTNLMSDCLWTGEPFRYTTNTKVNSAFHHCGVGKSSIGLSGCG